MPDEVILIQDFYKQDEADELFRLLAAQPHVRPRNMRNRNSSLRRLSFPGYAPPQLSNIAKLASRYGTIETIDKAPEFYRRISRDLSDYAGKLIEYLSTIGYRARDCMNYHQHAEDQKTLPDQTVYVLSFGCVHPVAIRHGKTVYRVNPKTGKNTQFSDFVVDGREQIIYPAHGSLYILPDCYNRPGSGNEAQHAVLEGNLWSYEAGVYVRDGLRISINAKAIPEGLGDDDLSSVCSRPAGRSNSKSPSLTVRPDGPPRIWSQRKGMWHPADAINVDRTTCYGNHLKLQGDEMLAYARKRAAEQGFPIARLRGKDLLCWCNEKQVAASLCHALAWLKVANE